MTGAGIADVEHVLIRKLEHLTGSAKAPTAGYAIEMRDRPGPAHKGGAFPDEVVWLQLHGGLLVAKARIEITWVGEYSSVAEVRRRTAGAPIHDIDDFWSKRPRFGYAAVGRLRSERWIEPLWAGPRTYGYEWVRLDNDKKHHSWLDHKDAPRGGEDLERAFQSWLAARS
jgi:hypothetical protein